MRFIWPYLLAALVMIYLSYLLPRLLPGDFVTAMYSSSHVTLNAEQEAGLRAYYTNHEGFPRYLIHLFTLDWGHSYAFHSPISDLILSALPWTLLLVGGAHVISMIMGFIAGVEAAWRRGGGVEKASVGCMTMLEGVPEIATGVVLLLVFAMVLGWFPASGAETPYAQFRAADRLLDVAHHLVLPFCTLIAAYLPGNFLLTRGSMVMLLKEQFVETARAKGLPPVRIRYAHAARNALPPMITRFGLRFAFMVTGALVVETIYAYPGLGTLLFNAVSMRDLPLIQSIVLISSLMVLIINLALEWIYGRMDPRVSHGV
ncbi:MAG: ABC transporter permease [Deltaproteobacteria bacterium HGW-Deltaproteobacteria-15]|jgi:peptide/nickel transport system permease protein|nr:MAG: ABC transporter permease [Deltaproteobacteria bacterium HGW-Deltaproteobacteria-15]